MVKNPFRFYWEKISSIHYLHFSSKKHVQRRIKGCCNIQDGVLCDNSSRLEAINYYHKALHLGCCSSPRSASDVPSQVLINFFIGNLATTPSTFLSYFFFEIYLSRIINYWGSIFSLYLTWGALNLVCVLSI